MPEVLGRKLFENFQIRRSKDKDLNINNVPRAFLTAASFSPPEAIRNKSKWNQDLAACLEVVRWRLGISAHTAAAVKNPSQGTETCAMLQKGLQSRDLCLDPLLHLVQHQSRCCSLSSFTPTSSEKKNKHTPISKHLHSAPKHWKFTPGKRFFLFKCKIFTNAGNTTPTHGTSLSFSQGQANF